MARRIALSRGEDCLCLRDFIVYLHQRDIWWIGTERRATAASHECPLTGVRLLPRTTAGNLLAEAYAKLAQYDERQQRRRRVHAGTGCDCFACTGVPPVG